MKKGITRLIGFVLSLAIGFHFSVNAFCSDGKEEANEVFSNVSAKSFVLMDGFTLSSLSEKNADRPLPMASTTKIMTCIVALDQASLSDQVLISKEAVGVEGSSVYLKQGEILTLEELLFALMLESANDAAVAIALHVSGSLDAFTQLMNEKAKSLGMSSTNYKNPHGLPCDGHFSTARDLSRLLAYCMQNEAFRVFVGTKNISISAPDSGKRYLSNHNKLLRIYDTCVGGKTGYTKEAGRCLVSAAEKNGRILICATLDDPNDWMDHVALFDYGFSLFEEKKIVSSCEISRTVSVIGGEKAEIHIQNDEEFSLNLRANEEITVQIEAPHFVYACVNEGDVLGTAVLKLNDREVKRLDLIAMDSVERSNEKLSFWQKLIQIIRLWIE